MSLRNVTLGDVYRMVRQRHLPELQQNDVEKKSVNHHLIRNGLSSALYNDLVATKIRYWLRSGDKTYMGVPFEVRAPFLDYRLVEYVAQLPTSYLVRDGWHKWILRRALTGLLPDDVLWRKRKMGFPFPFERFYSDSEPILRLIWSRATNPHLDLSQISKYRHNWRAISFVLWYELFFNRNYSLFEEIRGMATSNTAQSNYGYAPEYLEAAVEFP